jgi:acid-sensing ion channel, other
MVLKFPRKNGVLVSTDDYPMKASVRKDFGLKLYLDENAGILARERCTVRSLLIHSPLEVPAVFEIEEMIQFLYGYDLEVLVTPEIIKTDENLKTIDPRERSCYFEGEKRLKYFKLYTRRNCELECLSIHIEKLSNCTPYYLLRENSMEVCDHRFEVKIRIEISNVLKFWNILLKECECFDACNQINYRTEVISHTVPLNRSFYLYSSGQLKNFDFETEIEVKFKDVDVFPLRRYRKMTFSDFLAQSGGMLGLFAGISMLSIIELFYFLSLRWMVNWWRWIVKRFKKSRG